MTRAYNILAFLRHHGIGVREAMAFELIHLYGAATNRNVAEGMKVDRNSATQYIKRLRSKDLVEEAPFTRTAGTRHAKPRAEKVYRIKSGVACEWNILQTTNTLPKWAKRPAAPASGRMS